jgi:Uncharacterized protein conserved in bacteria
MGDMDYNELTEKFKSRATLFERLLEEALYALKAALEQAAIKYHSLPSRVKSPESFLEKVKRRETRESEEVQRGEWDPLKEVQDIVGLRVVCLYLSDVERIATVVRNTFQVLSEDNKIEGTEVSSFGYMSVHFVAVMKAEYSGPRYDNIANLPFEIQVRTIAMDAWANVSHHLDYKSDKDVPAELRKDFYALSGLFYVADRHFEMFYSQSNQSRREMKELFKDAVSNDQKEKQELNLDTLAAYLATKFPERQQSPSKDVSSLLSSLLKSGYTTIGEIDSLVDRGAPAFRLYEQEKTLSVTGRQFGSVGVVRVTMYLLDDRFVHEDLSSSSYIHNEEELKKAVQQLNEKYEKYRNLIE